MKSKPLLLGRGTNPIMACRCRPMCRRSAGPSRFKSVSHVGNRLNVVAEKPKLAPQRSDIAVERFWRHRLAARTDGFRDAAWREHLVGSRSEQLQNAIFDRSQSNCSATSLGEIGPRINDGPTLHSAPSAPRGALDILHQVHECRAIRASDLFIRHDFPPSGPIIREPCPADVPSDRIPSVRNGYWCTRKRF